jgi:hypothetical protein
MFGQIIDKLDSWFGRSFLLAWYFPWLLFFLANLLLAAVEFPEARAFLVAEYSRVTSSEKILDVFFAMSAVGVIAFTISPAIQPITRLMEGETLPRWIAEPLLLGHALRVQQLSMHSDTAFRDRVKLPKVETMTSRLAAMRAVGARLESVTDDEAIKTAASEIEKLQTLRYLNRTIGRDDLSIAVQALSYALQRNCAELIKLRPTVTAQDYAKAKQLDHLHRLMADTMLPYAIDVVERREAEAVDLRASLFGIAELAPTRLGNDVAALRSYCDSRYKFDFDLFWPRLQLVMKNQKIAERLAAAKIQVDFSILSLALSILFMAIWLSVLAVWGTSLISLLAIVVLGPPVIVLWLWMVHESYSAFAEFVRAAIDVSRFDLLEALRRPLPATTEAELKVWDQTARLLSLDEHNDTAFKHP